MEKYDYRAEITADVKNWIIDNRQEIADKTTKRRDFSEFLNDRLFVEDGVTGNASGSYTFNAWTAEENICHNLDLLREAMQEFGMENLPDYAEAADVTIRCYLLGECIETALDELEESGKIEYSED